MTAAGSSPDRSLEGKRTLLSRLDQEQRHWDSYGAAVFNGASVFDIVVSSIIRAVMADDARRGDESWRVRTKRLARTAGYEAKRRIQRLYGARRSDAPSQTDVLFLAQHHNHLLAQVPVADELRRRGHTVAFVATEGFLVDRIRQAGHRATNGLGAWTAAIHRAVLDGYLRSVRAANSTPPASVGWSEHRRSAAVKRTLVRMLPHGCEAIVLAERSLSGFAPKLIVVGDDLTHEGRAMARVAARHGVPTACFMHGNIAGSIVQSLHAVDRFLVQGDANVDALRALGADTSRSIVVGAPHLDHLPQQSGRVCPSVTTRLRPRADVPYVLWATTGPGITLSLAHHREMIRAVQSLARATPSIGYVVKVHHQDRKAYHLEEAGGVLPPNLLLVEPGAWGPPSIFEWLQGCRLLLVSASTVAVEAMLVDVPVLTIDFQNELEGVDFVAEGATTHVNEESRLPATVTELLSDGPARTENLAAGARFVTRAFHGVRGNAAGESADVLVALMNQEKPAAGSDGLDHDRIGAERRAS